MQNNEDCDLQRSRGHPYVLKPEMKTWERKIGDLKFWICWKTQKPKGAESQPQLFQAELKNMDE